ncbi:hypothetical protein [Dactylosporangium sp. NPDC000521]|uniref:hypothetical protein n=1 Tax=Dactylosporangium sp. NPDC000521 TaxID=3363975 RepID=UPI0036B71BA0
MPVRVSYTASDTTLASLTRTARSILCSSSMVTGSLVPVPNGAGTVSSASTCANASCGAALSGGVPTRCSRRRRRQILMYCRAIDRRT